jgi:Bacteriophage HK97-gp10, putative tail-component
MSVKILGMKEIQEAFRGLPRQFTDKLMQKANVNAARPLVDRIHRLAPVGLTGNLAESIGIVKSGSKNQGRLGEISVGPRRKGGFKGYAAHLPEYGTKPRRTRRGANRGVMPARPYERPAFDQTKNEVMEREKTELSKVTIAYLKRTVR